MQLESKIPDGPIEKKWERHRFHMKLLSPANKHKYHILVVGSGLAGASAAASLGELGFFVTCFCFQDSPRRAHSIAAQGGINAAKNYQNDGDSVFRLFYDTVKGGDYRAREANVYRLAELSNAIIDQCVAQGVPFAREYGGCLENRSFGGAQVSRTFYARGQTGQQLLLGAYSALSRQVGLGKVKMITRTEMLDLVVEKGRACGITTRNLVTGEISSWSGDAVVLASGGYSNVFFLSTNAKGCNAGAVISAWKKGALFANPCFTQIHPTCIPVTGEHQSKLTLMSESLRNDGRIWVPKEAADKNKSPLKIPPKERDYYLERRYPGFGNLVPRDVASRAAKAVCDEGRGVGPGGLGVYLDFEDSIRNLGKKVIRDKYGNLFQMYEKITAEDPYKTPMRIYPAVHYTMGGLWVDYNLMSNIPGLFVIGEANFSDHGANRLGASALMQGLADGYFILPYTLSDYLAKSGKNTVHETHLEFSGSLERTKARIKKIIETKGKSTPNALHRSLGKIMWNRVGMSRNENDLRISLTELEYAKQAFEHDILVTGNEKGINQTLENALRVESFLELSTLIVEDALARKESCGGHFREESQTVEGEALRNDDDFSYVAAWEYNGPKKPPLMHKEPLHFCECIPDIRSYK